MNEILFYRPEPSIERFETYDELERFMILEKENWASFLSETLTDSQNVQRIYELRDAWEDALSWSRMRRVNGHDFSAEEHDNAYSNRPLILFDSKPGQSIRSIAATEGASAAAGAWIYLRSGATNDSPHFPTQAAFLGAVSAVLDQKGMTKQSSQAAQNRAKNVAERHESQLSRYIDAMARNEAEFQEELAELKRKTATIEQDFESKLAANKELFDTKQAEAAKRWTGVINAFEKELELKAPITHWTNRARSHRQSAGKWAAQLTGWGSLGGAFVVLVAVILFRVLVFMPGDQEPKFIFERTLIAGSGTLFAATLYLWAMRIMMRLFVSEHHLGTDASSRAAMAYTYLSLVKKNALEEKDRTVVLEALFRPVSDGVVKDDAMPNFTPAAIISSTGMK